MKPARHTFYPEPEVFEALKDAPSKKLSERVNELIMKGLSKEREEAIRAEYDRFSQEIANSHPRKKDKKGVTSAMMLSKRLFEDDNSDEDLF